MAILAPSPSTGPSQRPAPMPGAGHRILDGWTPMPFGGHRPVTVVKPSPAPAGAPAGWTPPTLTAIRSSRAPGMLGTSWDAIRGVLERGDGQGLTPVQIARIAPHMAASFGIAPALVQHDLEQVRVYTGGAAAGDGSKAAVSIGHAIYVDGPAELDRMFSWAGRRWLVHELAHTMQWRRRTGAEVTPRAELAGTRKYLAGYVAGFPRAGVLGTWHWLRDRIGGGDGDGKRVTFTDALHDAHSMEHEAEAVAVAFRAANP